MRNRVAVAAIGLLAALSMIGPAGASQTSNPEPFADPEFLYWFAPPVDLEHVAGLDARGGRVVAADRDAGLVHVFEESGAFLMTIDGPGGAFGTFQSPRGVAIGGNGRIVVTDDAADRVSVFGPQGNHLFTFGSSGSAPGLFSFPVDAEIRNGGKIYVADAGNQRVQVFSPTGNHLETIGPDFDGAGEPLGTALAIDFDSQGNLLILHGHIVTSIYVIAPNGDFLREIAVLLDGLDVSVDNHDRVWKKTIQVIRVIDTEDLFLGTWLPVSTTAPAFDSAGRAIVATADRLEVYKFYKCDKQLATYVGTPNADFATGTAQDDVAVLRGGDDIYFGGSGRDTICGGPGADQLHGGTELDRIFGQAGPDEIYGNAQNDRLFGGAGFDSIFGGVGHDWLYGGNNADELRGGDGADKLFGGNGPDDCYGGAGKDTAASCASESGIP